MLWSDSILRDKRILITGASSGIGRSCAILFSQLGAKIIACGRDEKRLAQTLASLSGDGHISLAFELTNEEEIENKLVTLKGTETISGFVHSAGLERTNPLKTICMEDFTEMFKINVASAVVISRCVFKPGMYDRNGVSIVIISSMRGLQGEKGNIEYAATKSALYGLSKSMAKELVSKKARVNTISPSLVKTEMFFRVLDNLHQEVVDSMEKRHLIGIPEPLDVANMAAFLISDLSQFVTGTDIVLDSGYTIS